MSQTRNKGDMTGNRPHRVAILGDALAPARRDLETVGRLGFPEGLKRRGNDMRSWLTLLLGKRFPCQDPRGLDSRLVISVGNGSLFAIRLPPHELEGHVRQRAGIYGSHLVAGNGRNHTKPIGSFNETWKFART